MTHFNHNWTNDTPALPEALGDRYYAQDLNDDFNYLKHLPYEALLQGRTRAVVIPPEYTFENNILSLTGGIGVIAIETPVLDADEDFVVPPTTKNTTRFERVEFKDTTIDLSYGSDVSTSTQFIVATVTKKSLLQRAKAILSENYASRIKYEAELSLQSTLTVLADNQIIVGHCSAYDSPYYTASFGLLEDLFMKKDYDGRVGVKFKVSYGLPYTYGYGSYNEYFWNTDENLLYIKDTYIYGKMFRLWDVYPFIKGYYKNCKIVLESGASIDNNATFEDCEIILNKGGTNNGNICGYIKNAIFTRCIIVIEETTGQSDSPTATGDMYGCVCKYCNITFNEIKWGGSSSSMSDTKRGRAILGDNGLYEHCTITFNNIHAGGTLVSNVGIYAGTFKFCLLKEDVAVSGSLAGSRAVMYFVHAKWHNDSGISSSVVGKGVVLNDATVKGF